MERHKGSTQIEILLIQTLKFGALKQIKREGWLLKGVKNPESVADHNYRVGIMAMLILDQYPNVASELDRVKIYDLIMVHDWGITNAGDVISEKGKVNLNNDGKNNERTIVTQISNKFGLIGGRYVALWDEYHEQSTLESKFVKQVEKLEMALQALEYERMGYKNLNEFWENAEKYLEGRELEPIFRELQEMRKKNSS